MSQSHHLGSTGESKVLYELTKANFYVFTPFRGDSPIDLIALKDNKIWRIQVKSTISKQSSGYSVSLRNCSIRRKGMVKKLFNPKSCDILAVYIEPIDTICFIRASDIENRNMIHLREDLPKRNNQYRHWLISDFTSLAAFFK